MSINKDPNKNIEVIGARVNNLKNINVSLPLKKLIVITGLSGSGKSSLAFDTIFAEGNRRYIETFSAYARNFMGNFEKPDVDKISGLSPVISIEQKTTNKNPRSTVGTITEIYDYMRILFARTATAYSYATGEKMVKYSEEHLQKMILSAYEGKKIMILAPLVKQRKGHYRELFETLRKKGFISVRIDGNITELTRGLKVDRYKNHNIEVIVDKIAVKKGDNKRLERSITDAMRQSEGIAMVYDVESKTIKNYSKRLMCPTTGMAYKDPSPNCFSFNSPEGACKKCKGLGVVNEIDVDKIIDYKKISIKNGAIIPLGKYSNQLIFHQIEAVLLQYDLDLNSPVSELNKDVLEELLYGSTSILRIPKEKTKTSNDLFLPFFGILNYISNIQEGDDVEIVKSKTNSFIKSVACSECRGDRLNQESLSYRIADKNISQLCNMSVDNLYKWLNNDDLFDNQNAIVAKPIIKEIKQRLLFLVNVGLNYLSLNRSSASLSGGESQRIRLTTQLGANLVNVLYIIDEPSIGLHPKDNKKLITTLLNLRDEGNTVVVVEHDQEIMHKSDYIVDIGPGAGVNGGKVVFQGTPQQLIKTNTITAKHLKGANPIKAKQVVREGLNKSIIIKGATGNNLKNVDLEFPLGKLIVITGVSGSGKSTIINQTLLPILTQKLYRTHKEPLAYKEILGDENINKVVSVDQSPIGRTPRSIPATYIGVFDEIRALFASLPESKTRGYKQRRFSFNVKGGQCEECSGYGSKSIEMSFLPNVKVHCYACNGKRYNRETLSIKYNGKSIFDVLDMTALQAADFFSNIPSIARKIQTLCDVGLGYIKLGQASTTLSGGESQRVKLAAELWKKETGKTLYILDEPTTGLHSEDVRILMNIINQLVDKQNTVIIIEHNVEVINQADYIIDIGPDGGNKGGEIVAYGTPMEVAKNKKGHTYKYIQL